MTQTDKQKIIDYLSGPRNFAEGAALYSRYGVNLRLKRQFSIDAGPATREILFNELRKLAGLSETEFARLPRRARRPDKPDRAPAPAFIPEPDDVEAVKYEEAPEPVKKMIRFREKYKFLDSPDCPDVLKILVADLFTAYGNYKTAHARLQVMGDAASAEAAANCEAVVENYLNNREIWDELEHFRETGQILGKAAKFREMEEAENLAALSDVDLMGKLKSAEVQVSKQSKKVADAKAKGEENETALASLELWTAKKSALKAELEKRKKK